LGFTTSAFFIACVVSSEESRHGETLPGDRPCRLFSFEAV
jgi:hypothetical protein